MEFGGKKMEKEIWKWILETFTDERIANLALSFGIKIPGFRQINPQQKNFKMVRPRIIQEALHQRNAQKLTKFFQSAAKKQPEIESLRGKSLEEQLQAVEKGLTPSILLGLLLSSEEEEDQARAREIYIKLIEEERLELLEKQVDEKMEMAENIEGEQGETFKHLQNELKLAHQQIEKIEKKLKRFEQKNEELKSQETQAQTKLKNERKQWKEEKKYLLHEVQTLKAEQGSLKNKITSVSSEKESLQKKLEKQRETLKIKDDEISRLHALVLKLNTDLEKIPSSHLIPEAKQKIKVAMIGNPKNNHLQMYKKYDLTIIEATEIQEEKNRTVLNSSDQVWLLTYKTPRSIQKKAKSIVKEKQMKEFSTFLDLENYMLKGMY